MTSARRFTGRTTTARVWVKPYEADEVYRTLATIAPYDWKGFFEKRLQAKTAAIPLGGVEGGGYRLVYTEAPNMFTDPWTLDGSLNAYGSLGIHVAADGTVDDAWQGMPAFIAGVTNGMKIIAVNGRRFSQRRTRARAPRLQGRARANGAHRRKRWLLQDGESGLSRRPEVPASRARRHGE